VPAVGCYGDQVWVAAGSGKTDHVYASGDGGATWSDRGPAPANLVDLLPEQNGTGFAVSASGNGSPATLWSVDGNGARFTSRPLPSWIKSLGATTDAPGS
jgi:hypothetical protein